MEKSILEKEISMPKFLSVFLGLHPVTAKNITHEDAKILFSDLESYSDREFWDKCRREESSNYVRVKDKNKKVKYYRTPEMIINETDTDEIEETSLKSFLGKYLGENPSYTRFLTHEQALKTYEQINALTQSEYDKLDDPLKTTDFIRVTDSQKKVLYYDKFYIYKNMDDEELEELIIQYRDMNLDELEKWELLELRKKLKQIQKNNKQVLDRQITNISKTLTKRKKALKND